MRIVLYLIETLFTGLHLRKGRGGHIQPQDEKVPVICKKYGHRGNLWCEARVLFR